MVEQIVVQQVQEALVSALNKRFDGEAYIGVVQNPKFVIDFFAHDREIVTQDEIADFISEFTATYEGVHASNGGDTYAVNIAVTPDTRYKYQFVLELDQLDK